MQRYLTSPIPRKVESEATMKYPLTPVRLWLLPKPQEAGSVDEAVQQREQWFTADADAKVNWLQLLWNNE